MGSRWRFTTLLVVVATCFGTLVSPSTTGDEAPLHPDSAPTQGYATVAAATTQGYHHGGHHPRYVNPPEYEYKKGPDYPSDYPACNTTCPTCNTTNTTCPTCEACETCVCTAGYGGQQCSQCAKGSFSLGGVTNCTACGDGLTSPAGATSPTSCLSDACAADGFIRLDIPATPGTQLVTSVVPDACYIWTEDDTTAVCNGGDPGSMNIAPAVKFYIPAADVPRNISVTTCVDMAHDPVTLKYAVDTTLAVWESDNQCAITTNATTCSNDWLGNEVYDFSEDPEVQDICYYNGAEVGFYNLLSYTIALLEAGKEYVVVTSYLNDFFDYCSPSCGVEISMPLVTTFTVLPDTAKRSTPAKSRRRAPPAHPRPSPEELVEQRIAALKAKHYKKRAMAKRRSAKQPQTSQVAA